MMMNLIKDCITFFQAGGVFMYPLAACSVLLIAAVIYRMFNMKKSLICPVVLTRAVEQYTRGAVGRTELERIAADSDSVEGRLVLDALNSPLEDEASLKEMIQVKAREEFVTLQAGLPLLDMIAMIAPMFGWIVKTIRRPLAVRQSAPLWNGYSSPSPRHWPALWMPSWAGAA